MPQRTELHAQRGFTLLELLVVMVIIGLLAQRRVVSLLLEAPDAASAQASAEGRGLLVLSLRRGMRLPAIHDLFQPRFPLLQFTQELVALLRAGLSLTESLEVMVEKE